MSKRELVKSLFVQGMSIEKICTLTGLSRQGIYYMKKDDFSKGIDWENLKLVALRDEKDLENKEAIFLNALISEFERFLEGASKNELDIDTLEALNKYAKTYWAIKAPQKVDIKALNLQTCKKTIDSIIELASSNEVVCEWLSDNSDLIISKVLK
ncbi:DUF1804 family protein [Campylobacter lari]|uniref:DUF1804 family protein n=1 Tax=Campylobacter TaxID=194 RepID=UPI001079E5EF|nr:MULTISPECIES: DUF1804 family protein [Campylobacter]EAI7174542.1 DUF1804 family protein [Campylobacter coli]EAC1839744.1 DUF1804 family protein [Campylobacter lari]EAH6869446.1 DUF1804 family protein [Campylobacter lari]EAH7781168.1 DUF1804 family protein [Campylobacter lari]EAH8420582.1 DUF1804 family protein [Campylobacter lari]